MGTIAEIRSFKRGAEGDPGLSIIALGLHRFRVQGAIRERHITQGCIVEDAPINIPQDAKKNKAFYPVSVWKTYDSRVLMRKLQSVAYATPEPHNLAPRDPTSYSFWIARNLPIPDKIRQSLLETLSTPERLRMELQWMVKGRALCCRVCQCIIANAESIFSMSTDGIMTPYVNSYGHIHETITLKKAANLFAAPGSMPSLENTWFPGYAWTIMYCRRCALHIGWRYDAIEPSMSPRVFWGVTRPSVIMSL